MGKASLPICAVIFILEIYLCIGATKAILLPGVLKLNTIQISVYGMLVIICVDVPFGIISFEGTILHYHAITGNDGKNFK